MTKMANDQSVLAVIRASRPSFKNPHDKIAFSVHASFLASGYVLHGTGPAAFAEDALSSSSTGVEVGIDHWNDVKDEYAFIYSNPDKGSKKILIKCLAMNDMLLVDGIEENGSDPLHVELSVGDYTVENGGTSYASQYKNLDKLVSIVEKDLMKVPTSGSTAEPSSYSSGTRDIEKEPDNPIHQPYTSGYIYPPIGPLGGSDIVPGPGAGIYPMGGYGRDDLGIGGGMFVGPNHPMFVRMGREPNFPGAPPGIGVPPGARFDPYGPPGVPGFELNRFGRRGPGHNHPDLEPFRDGSDDFI